jgi:hypothetical protein
MTPNGYDVVAVKIGKIEELLNLVSVVLSGQARMPVLPVDGLAFYRTPDGS